MSKTSLRVAAAFGLVFGLASWGSTANAQEDVEAFLNASGKLGPVRTQARSFNPFNPGSRSRLSRSRFGLPTGLDRFSAFSSSTRFDNPFDPNSTSSSAGNTVADTLVAEPAIAADAVTLTQPVVVESISGGQSQSGSAAVGPSFSWNPVPVRSPYRPPARGAF